jgi:uncharacterized protein with ParB-like and HNH nuclease domain
MNNGKTLDTLFELLEKYLVEVPKVQRDYAQGRTDDGTSLVRRNLLQDMKASVLHEKPPLDLNFVYGKINSEGRFIPIDGQQRLTTLFLLHVYAYHDDEEKTPLLRKFTYETRKSSRDFLEQLVEHREEVFTSNAPSYEIGDSEWFVSGWKHDPTIQSALVMLDGIKETFSDVDSLADSLSGEDYEPIVFKFLDIEDLSMEDSLYIKLNARGKPLTLFENYKARLIGRIKELDIDFRDEFEHLFDGKWTDLFWESHREDFDRTFLMFFSVFLMNHEIISSDYSNWSNAFDYETFDEKMFETIYHTLNYIGDNPDDVETRSLFFAALSEERRYPDRVLFHAITTYLYQSEGTDNGSFSQWRRILRNLTLNTEIDDSRTYRRAIDGINNLKEQWADLLSYFDEEGNVSGFSVEQVSEEQTKAQLIQDSDVFAQAIYVAEKHQYFSGQIRSALYYAENPEGAFDMDTFTAYWEKISAMFEKSKPVHDNLLRRALLSLGDYTMPVGDYLTLCVNDPNEGESTPSMKRLFSNHGTVVRSLLDAIDVSNDIDKQLDSIIAKSNVPTNDWRYCFIKYSELFKLMSVANLRLRVACEEMLIVPNKSSNGYNRMAFLAALAEALKEKNVETKQNSGQGTWAEHWMWIGDEDEGVYTKYKDGAFTFYRGAENENSVVLFTTETENPIDEAAKYVVEELS